MGVLVPKSERDEVKNNKKEKEKAMNIEYDDWTIKNRNEIKMIDNKKSIVIENNMVM